jgi:DNA-binding MarR family transcriptional regulator
MNATVRRLRMLHQGALPLRVAERLLDVGTGRVDGMRHGLHHSGMNDMPPQPVARTEVSDGPAESAATLFTFLDIADVLYERIGRALSSVGLSYPKYEVLTHLQCSADPVSLGCLAEEQSCARSNITQLIDRLETEGLVRRVPDPDDRRGVRAELTEVGVAAANEGQTQMDLVLAEFAASFTGPERTQLGRLLAKLG